MGCYLSGLKIIIYNIYLFIKKKQYVELRGKNMGCYYLLTHSFYYFLLFIYYLERAKSSKQF